MKFQKTILVSAMAAVLGLAACSGEKAATPASGASGAAAAPAGDPVKVGVTIYKYDDNFMSLMRKALENEAATQKTAELLLNDSQNSQSTQNDQVDILISKGVKVLAINLVDPSAAPTIISKAQAANIPVIFFNKGPWRRGFENV